MNLKYPDPGKVCPGEATARRDAPTWAAMTMSRSVATFLGAVAGLIGAFVTPGRERAARSALAASAGSA